MLGLVAFVMLSPQAQEAVFGEFGGVDEFLQSQLAPYHIYPNEASYTLSKTYEHTKEFGSGQGTENILIPPTYMSSLSGQDQFVVQGEDDPYEPTVLQQTLQITVAIDGQEIDPLLMEIEARLRELQPDLNRVSSGRSGITETLTERLWASQYFDDVVYLEGRHTIEMNPDRYLGAWRSVNDVRVQLGPKKFESFIRFVEAKIADLSVIKATYMTRAWSAQRIS